MPNTHIKTFKTRFFKLKVEHFALMVDESKDIRKSEQIFTVVWYLK